MAVLERNEIFAKAYLTRRGREIIFSENERFQPTKFALFDDEVNYNLVDGSSDDGDVLSLAVFEAPRGASEALRSRLIRYSNNLELIARQNQFRIIPQSEYQIKTQVSGSATLSIQKWLTDEIVVSFSVQSPTDLTLFLTDGFTVDLSTPFNDYGIALDILPVQPSATIGDGNNYWFNMTDKYKDASGNVLPVLVGVDSSHKPVNGTALSSLTNGLGIPTVTFKLRLRENQLRAIYNAMFSQNLTFIATTIRICNNDQTLVPLTDFYGPTGGTYQSIAALVPINIVF